MNFLRSRRRGARGRGAVEVPAAFQLYSFLHEDGVWWRLLSPNGRGLAWSSTAFVDGDEARAALARLVGDVDGLEPVTRLTPDHRWRWSLRRDGVDLAQGISAQDRRVRCAAACRSFVELVPTATLAPTVAVFPRPEGSSVARVHSDLAR